MNRQISLCLFFCRMEPRQFFNDFPGKNTYVSGPSTKLIKRLINRHKSTLFSYIKPLKIRFKDNPIKRLISIF